MHRLNSALVVGCMQTIISKSTFNRNQSIDSGSLAEATQNRYSMALFSEPGSHARHQLSNSFDVRLVSLHTPIHHFDCCLIDCRGQQLTEPALTNVDNFTGVKFVLIDEFTIISNARQAISGHYQLITENEFDSPALMARVSAHALLDNRFDVTAVTAKTGGSAQDDTTESDKLSAASHDIRQPLQAISLFIHSLESKLNNEQQHSILSKLKQSTTSLHNSLDDMLGLIKASAPKLDKSSVNEPATINNRIVQLHHADSANKPLQNYTVMVLDNNEEIVAALETNLQDAGMHVYPATNLDEACEIINEIDQLPDMLLVDFNLDDNCTGDDAIQMICNTAKKVIPSIVITSETCTTKLHRAQEIATAVLRKPVQADHLLATINHYIDDTASC